MTIAVITGASRGLGAGMAERFAQRGVTVAACARTEPSVEGAAMTASVDVADGPAVHGFADEVAARLGPIDLWVNNAGILDPMGPLRTLSTDDVEHHLRVNVMGVVHGTQAFLRHRHPDGVLVNISSGAALKGRAGWAAYCAGKAAVDRITEAVQLEEAATGLRAYAVAPGVVDTAMQEQIRGSTEDVFPDVDAFRRLKEAGAFNTPPYVADRILDLLEQRPADVVLRLPDEHGQ